MAVSGSCPLTWDCGFCTVSFGADAATGHLHLLVRVVQVRATPEHLERLVQALTHVIETQKHFIAVYDLRNLVMCDISLLYALHKFTVENRPKMDELIIAMGILISSQWYVRHGLSWFLARISPPCPFIVCNADEEASAFFCEKVLPLEASPQTSEQKRLCAVDAVCTAESLHSDTNSTRSLGSSRSLGSFQSLGDESTSDACEEDVAACRLLELDDLKVIQCSKWPQGLRRCKSSTGSMNSMTSFFTAEGDEDQFRLISPPLRRRSELEELRPVLGPKSRLSTRPILLPSIVEEERDHRACCAAAPNCRIS
eukprot:gnl/TRDRNA2_/TRDRNA2_58516_c0_seq1.p1 gnl/TRDRNA2_/TRDRNA2_58516_c0~~gnl/TRDRNA2_/TRDRNA2_58516_c0_seq1.p1  ORF type:complete len:327 (-),score=50.10 gnl/TRDRNA2_/TRDRNA2_58516_c0_seq1:32-967(-)